MNIHFCLLALHLAASEGHFDVALFLLEIGKVKPDPRDRSVLPFGSFFTKFSWNRTPLDDAREAAHTSVALLLERRMQELEQAKTIPAGRPINLASKANSLQMLPSQHGGQKGILHQSSSGTDLKEPLEIETAESWMEGKLGITPFCCSEWGRRPSSAILHRFYRGK